MEAVPLQIKETRHLAQSIEELPDLGENQMRVVHITTPQSAEEILNTGLDYEKYGMAMSTARAWGKKEEVEYSSDDPRFNYSGLKAVVMDMSDEEWKNHNKVGNAPGRILPEKIVGIVNAVVRDSGFRWNDSG